MRFKARLAALRRSITREKILAKAKQLGRVLLNPRLLVCLVIAWMITNGWSYILFCVGMALQINWMRAVAGAYMGFLWLPFTPEKLITVAIAILLLRLFFPKDEKTLGALRTVMARVRRRRGVE